MTEPAKTGPRGNPKGWRVIKSPHLPVGGYEYRVTTDGEVALIQRKIWRTGNDFRTRRRVPLDRWQSEFEQAVTGKPDYDVALTLARWSLKRNG